MVQYLKKSKQLVNYNLFKEMKFFVFILLCSPAFLFGQFSSEKLIDFDKRSSKKYVKKHKVITALLDEQFNFGSLANPSDNTIWVNEINNNFSTLYNGKKRDQLRVSNESIIYDWLKEHRFYRIYFFMNEDTGIPELIGYSKKGIKPKIRKRFRKKENIDLIDFTNVDISTLDPANYVVGWLEIEGTFPLFFKKEIVLVYPTDLTLEPQTFIGTYTLSKRLSIGMSEVIMQINPESRFQGARLVLKKIGKHYQIVGFTRRKQQ